MEIITNVTYNEHRHSLKAFSRRYEKMSIIPIINHKTVRDAMHNRDMIVALEVIMSYDWISGNMRPNTTIGQNSYIKLAGDIVVNAHVIINDKGDRLCIMDVIQRKTVHNMIIAYVGDTNTFNHYMTELGISELERYSDIRHLVEGDE